MNGTTNCVAYGHIHFQGFIFVHVSFVSDNSSNYPKECVMIHNRFPCKLSILTFFFIRDYVRSELESGYEGPVYLEPLSMNRFTTALIGIKLHMDT